MELQKAIEDVVFAKLDEIQKEGYSSFGELRKAREAASNIQKESLRGELATLQKKLIDFSRRSTSEKRRSDPRRRLKSRLKS